MTNTTLKAVVVVLLALLLPVAVWFGITQWQRATADYRGETDQIEQTRANEQFRIQAYDHFYDLCAAVQTAESRIENLELELESTTDADRQAELRTAITANRNNRAELINQYNVDARKEWTSGQFRANDLPYQLDESDETTECVA